MFTCIVCCVQRITVAEATVTAGDTAHWRPASREPEETDARIKCPTMMEHLGERIRRFRPEWRAEGASISSLGGASALGELVARGSQSEPKRMVRQADGSSRLGQQPRRPQFGRRAGRQEGANGGGGGGGGRLQPLSSPRCSLLEFGCGQLRGAAGVPQGQRVKAARRLASVPSFLHA